MTRVGVGKGARWLAAGGLALLLTAAAAAADSRATAGSVDLGRRAAEACQGGIVVDDGTLETGYGWVPSVRDGRYVQRFERADLGADQFLREVCVCWTRTRPDTEVSFRVELYFDAGGEPRMTPAASLEALATAVPAFPDGAFTTVTIPDGGWFVASPVYYVGARWDASVDQFFFVCADRSAGTPVTGGFFTDDRATGWGDVLNTSDPIFAGHRAMMVRLVGGPPPAKVPAAGPAGAALLVVLTAIAGLAVLRRAGF